MTKSTDVSEELRDAIVGRLHRWWNRNRDAMITWELVEEICTDMSREGFDTAVIDDMCTVEFLAFVNALVRRV